MNCNWWHLPRDIIYDRTLIRIPTEIATFVSDRSPLSKLYCSVIVLGKYIPMEDNDPFILPDHQHRMQVTQGLTICRLTIAFWVI